VGINPLTLPSDEANKVIRRRRREVADRSIRPTTAGWERAFEALIMFYEKHHDVGMADVLRLDLDRYTRQAEQVARAKEMKEAG
jgi:hypothetical protein